MAKVTIPTKNNLDIDRGAIVLSITDYTPVEDMHLLTLGQVSLHMKTIDNQVAITLDVNKEQVGEVMIEEEPLDIIISWRDNHLWFSVFSQEILPNYMGSTGVLEIENIFGDQLSLFEDNFFNGTYEKIAIYSQSLSLSELGPFSLEVFEETTEQLFEADFTTPTHYKKDVVIEDTFAPKDGSPILLEDDKGPLNRQFFFDETTSEYKNEVIEEFTFKGEAYQRLSYANIEESYKVKIEFQSPEGLDILYQDVDFTVSDQQIFFDLSNESAEAFYGLDYTVTYQVSHSYNVEFNEDVPHDGFRINLVNMKAAEDGDYYSSTEDIRLIREGNRFENDYLAKEIELNPLVNPQVQGFMYIDTAEQKTQAFRITASSQYLNGNGIDTASLMIEAIDSEGNEVLSPYVTVRVMNDTGDLTSGFGQIEPIVGYQSMKARNTSGRLYYEFTAPTLTEEHQQTHKVYILAYDRQSRIGAQFPIYIQSVRPDQTFELSRESTAAAAIPFEYFARYFEQELPEEHPLEVYDTNENQQLERNELKDFSKDISNKTVMETLSQELIALENKASVKANSWASIVKNNWEDLKDITWEELDS